MGNGPAASKWPQNIGKGGLRGAGAAGRVAPWEGRGRVARCSPLAGRRAAVGAGHGSTTTSIVRVVSLFRGNKKAKPKMFYLFTVVISQLWFTVNYIV